MGYIKPEWLLRSLLISMIVIGGVTTLIIVALVLFGGIDAFSLISKEWFSPIDWTAFSGVATALGALGAILAAVATFTAAYIALLLGGKEAQWKMEERRRSKVAVEFYAVNIVPSLLINLEKFEDLRVRLSDVDSSRYESDLYCLNELIGFLKGIDLDKLAVLSYPTANNLATSLYQLGVIKAMYPHPELERKFINMRRDLLQVNLKTAKKKYSKAYNFLQKIANDALG